MNKVDPLQEALKAKQKHISYSIPQKYEQIFMTKELDLEYFNMSLFQRALCFIGFFIIGSLCFLYSMMRIFTAVIYPAQFALPYAISNVLFFFMFGFLLGFKSYLCNVLSEKKRIYTIFFVTCTLITLYGAFFKFNYIVNLILCITQICSFIVFAITFIPGGTNGIGSMVSLVLRR